MVRDPYKYFRIEARELLDQLGKGILDLEKGAPAHDPVARLLRVAHTLKGAARVVKQREIADHAHAVEDALAPFRESTDSLPSDRIDIVLRLLEDITSRVAAVAPPPEAGAPSASVPSREEPSRTVRTDLAEMDALLDGVAEVHGHLESLLRGVATVESARHLVDLVIEQLAPHRSRQNASPGNGACSDRARSMVEDLRETLGKLDRNLASSVEQMDRELQQVRDAAERLRLVSAGSLFTSLERAARDVAQEQGKQVAFDCRGGGVRLDAHVLGGVEGALQQLVRNAVAHGIEPAAERTKAGKQPEGRVVLEVARRGRRVVFACRDDGRGVDLEGVRRAVERKGLLSAEARSLGPEELLHLLLRAGISTSRTVTEVSGRGIGLDLVRDSAERLGGEVVVRTAAGKGTTVELAVPLSLASLEALVVESSGVTATIPLDAVRQTMRVAPSAVARSPEGETILHEGRVIPFFPLARALRVTSVPESGSLSCSAVVVEGGGAVAAFGVDRLLGTSNVILRPLPELASCSAVVAGVSLDAQGTAQLVLDPDGLVTEAQRAGPMEPTSEAARPPILVIDDSLTTRMLEQSILESAGYRVDVATSAEEGLEKARDSRYGLFLVDVEMPGMDGFTFIERTRSDPFLRDVPAILVTSRASVEDRQRGQDVGARGYIVKSEFDQRELIECIRKLAVR